MCTDKNRRRREEEQADPYNSYLQGGRFSLKHKRQTWKETPGLPGRRKPDLKFFYVR